MCICIIFYVSCCLSSNSDKGLQIAVMLTRRMIAISSARAHAEKQSLTIREINGATKVVFKAIEDLRQ